jgi:DNA ligase-1
LAFRRGVGVSQRLVLRGLAEASGVPVEVLAHRLMGDWQPTPLFWTELTAPEASAPEDSRPYPFCLAYPLDSPPGTLGPISEWQVEWEWDGIRA